MIELRIAAATPGELIHEASNMLVLLANGAKIAAALQHQASRQPDVPEAENAIAKKANVNADIFPTSDDVGAEPLANPSASGPPPAKRGRKPKSVTIEATANPTDLPVADFLDEPKPVEAPAASFTIENVKDAVKQCLDNYTTRARQRREGYASLKGAALNEVEQKIMADKVAYTKRLLLQFDANKVTDLKPEDYPAFMAASKAFIDGSAEVA